MPSIEITVAFTEPVEETNVAVNKTAAPSAQSESFPPLYGWELAKNIHDFRRDILANFPAYNVVA